MPNVEDGNGNVITTRDLAVQFSDLKMATETRPQVFSGKAEEEVDSWLRRFNRIAAALEWNEAQKVKQAPIFLDSFAAQWYDKTTQNGTIPFATWKALEDGLLDRFRPRDLT